MNPFTDSASNVFSVDIVIPGEGIKSPDRESIKPAIKEKKPAVVKRLPGPSGKQLPPETMYGEKTESYEKSGESSGSLQSQNGAAENNSHLAPRSQLFDKKTIEEFASKGSPAKKGLTFDTTEFKHRGYMKMLKERIEGIWKYPGEAVRHGISGDLHMKFSIKKDGKLGEIELLRTSGYRELDEAAMKAVKNAAPFWPLPEDWDKETLEVNGHFIYIFGNTLVF